MNPSILRVAPLAFPWQTLDPFLFCVHHNDAYPSGNAAMGPSVPLTGRDLGQDFAGKDGWSMYHGKPSPAFLRIRTVALRPSPSFAKGILTTPTPWAPSLALALEMFNG
jgi:hypothetical protein